MTKLSQRTEKTEASGIRRIFDLAANTKNPINLSIGQPDFDVPECLKDQVIDAIRAGRNSYTQTQGGPELRAKLLAGPLKDYGEKELLISGAVSGGLLLSYMALLDSGDEILIPDPYFVMYKQLAFMFDAKPVFYDCYPEWRLDAAEVEKRITSRTKAIIFASPANPTGAVCGREEMTALAKVADRHGLVVITDEIYEYYSYDAPMIHMRDLYREKTLTLGGFSKSHAMTGWRVGWAAGPEDLIQAMTKFQQFSFVCAPTPFQIAAAAAVDYRMDDHMAAYKAKRDFIYHGLIDAGYEVTKPGGAFYAFPKLPWGTGLEFVEECVRNNLLVIPGNCFSERDTHFRIAYTASGQTLERGLEILKRLRSSGPAMK